MNVEQFLEEMKTIQDNLLVYLEDESNNYEHFESLKYYFVVLKIHEEKHMLISLLHLLLKISNNHLHDVNFFDKIEKILQTFQEDIKKYYSNAEIFNIFKTLIMSYISF